MRPPLCRPGCHSLRTTGVPGTLPLLRCLRHMSDTCSQFMCRDCVTIYSSLTQAQSLCAKTWAPSLCATTTTHAQVPHAMTTQAQNPCVKRSEERRVGKE